jgi:NitT/TauT family transport system substrate-binding protein
MPRASHFIALSAVAAALAASPALGAEVKEIRLAKQFSMGYVQLNVMEDRALIEKHARDRGLGEVKVSWTTFNGPNTMNDALLSGSVDIVSGGVPGLVTLWAKTRGMAQEVKGIAALSSQPFLLNARRPELKTIRDFGEADRIAVPAVKVSVQAVTLQMAAAAAWGPEAWVRLDPLTVSMSPPDATIALMSGAGEITAAFSVPPFQQQQLEKPGIHTILNSFEVLGGPHTFTCAWTSAKFHDANPMLYAALLAALEEATLIINEDKQAAAALWARQSSSKLPLELVQNVIAGPDVTWTLTPTSTMKFAAFMAKTAQIKEPPTGWQDLFFAELRAKPGS